jgi:hypothetical protein
VFSPHWKFLHFTKFFNILDVTVISFHRLFHDSLVSTYHAYDDIRLFCFYRPVFTEPTCLYRLVFTDLFLPTCFYRLVSTDSPTTLAILIRITRSSTILLYDEILLSLPYLANHCFLYKYSSGNGNVEQHKNPEYHSLHPNNITTRNPEYHCFHPNSIKTRSTIVFTDFRKA